MSMRRIEIPGIRTIEHVYDGSCKNYENTSTHSWGLRICASIRFSWSAYTYTHSDGTRWVERKMIHLIEFEYRLIALRTTALGKVTRELFGTFSPITKLYHGTTSHHWHTTKLIKVYSETPSNYFTSRVILDRSNTHTHTKTQTRTHI